VPAHLYRGVHHFLADTDWDHREVIWAAAAEALEHFELDWLASMVSSAGGWTFAWLAAYSGAEVLPLDLVLIGPSEGLPAERLVPAQRDILRRAPDSLLRSAPVGCVNSIALQIARFRGRTEFAHPTRAIAAS
jgi:hypothetical protein